MEALAAVIAGLGAAAVLGAEVRRRSLRSRLSRGLHELRRPLQALALAIEREGAIAACGPCLEQARCALEQLDATIAGRRLDRGNEPISAAEIVAEAGRRWGLIAGVRVRTPEHELQVLGDRARLAQGLDNLIANALEHGRGPVCVEAVADGEEARFEVRDSGLGPLPVRRPASDPRRGLGLRVAAQIAREHGGELEPPAADGAGTAASIRVPAGAGG